MSAGLKFKQAIANNHPLQVVGTINAYTAMMAEKMGHQAIYLSDEVLILIHLYISPFLQNKTD